MKNLSNIPSQVIWRIRHGVFRSFNFEIRSLNGYELRPLLSSHSKVFLSTSKYIDSIARRPSLGVGGPCRPGCTSNATNVTEILNRWKINESIINKACSLGLKQNAARALFERFSDVINIDSKISEQLLLDTTVGSMLIKFEFIEIE